MKTRQVIVRYEGRVQGVGFRWVVRELASRRAVSGFVRNEPDRSVTVVAEGTEDELMRLLQDVRGSRLAGGIGAEKVQWADAQGRPEGFSIAH